MQKVYVLPVEFELSCDEEGLTTESWDVITAFQNAIEALRYDYGWKEIAKVGMPRLKKED